MVATCARRLRVEEGRELARSAHAQLDVSDGIAVDLGHIARRSGVRCVVELERVPLAGGATLDDVGFGEDFELLAAVPEAGRFAAIGRVEEGEGVELLLHGKPFALGGWEHFTRVKHDPALRGCLTPGVSDTS